MERGSSASFTAEAPTIEKPYCSPAISQTTVRQVRKSRPVRDPSQSKAPLVVLFILAKLLEGRKRGSSDTL
jgi:hypothetical protein